MADSDAKKIAQDYDHTPPRCATCVYMKRRLRTKYVERTSTNRRGKPRTILVAAKRHATRNPLVDYCTFGNFEVRPQGVCNEWHSRDGERIENERVPMRLIERADAAGNGGDRG